MHQIKSYSEKINVVASKCIIGLEYEESNIPILKFVTLNPSIIGDGLSECNYIYNHDDEYHHFFDVVEKKWFKYSEKNHISFIYYNLEANNVSCTGDLFFINDNSIIDNINKDTIKMIDDNTRQIKELLSNVIKYNKQYDGKLFNIYSQLMLSGTLTYDEALFSSIFNITIDEYRSDKIQNVPNFIEIFKNVIKFYEDKAVYTIESEIQSDSLDDDEKEELKLIIDMINESVAQSYDKCKNLTEPWEILEEYPTILYPIPIFIEDERGNDSYTKSKIKIQNFFKK